MDMVECDVVIIGAGLYGIQAARTYLEIHPIADVLVLEATDTIGGAWSSERSYQYFWTQIPIGMVEYSDIPMAHIEDSDQYYDLFPAKYVTKYLDKYVDSHTYNGRSLRSRIRTSTRVSRVAKIAEKWCITVEDPAVYIARKIIDATGLTSIPNIPNLSGISKFKGFKIHHRELGQSNVLGDERLEHVAVIGGAKSAADVAYSAAKAGKSVSWIIRKSGAGPAYFVEAKGIAPFKNSSQSLYTRFTATFTASLWYERTWWTNFLSNTSLGRWSTLSFWGSVDRRTLRSTKLDREEGKDRGFANLKPDVSLFWENDSTGVKNRADFFETIATHAKIYREDISSISEHSINLADGTSIPTDAIIYATGYAASSPHYDQVMTAKLGLPVSKAEEDSQRRLHWQALEEAADKAICIEYPILIHPPPYYHLPSPHTPFRLYKAIVPTSDSSIVFLGKVATGNHFRITEAQALWAVAVLDGIITLPPPEMMEKEIARTVAWCRRRYLSKGEPGNWFPWDVVPYTDMLLKDLGLTSHRRKRWAADFFRPCVAADLKGIIAEYKEKHQA